MTAKRTQKRLTALRQILEDRRRQLSADMTGMMREVRSRAGDESVVADAFDGLHADVQDDLELAMIQMKAEMLHHVDAALRRLAAGAYGDCADCHQEIPHERLRALPFATRCVECQTARERRVESGRGARRAYDQLTDS